MFIVGGRLQEVERGAGAFIEGAITVGATEHGVA